MWTIHPDWLNPFFWIMGGMGLVMARKAITQSSQEGSDKHISNALSEHYASQWNAFKDKGPDYLKALSGLGLFILLGLSLGIFPVETAILSIVGLIAAAVSSFFFIGPWPQGFFLLLITRFWAQCISPDQLDLLQPQGTALMIGMFSWIAVSRNNNWGAILPSALWVAVLVWLNASSTPEQQVAQSSWLVLALGSILLALFLSKIPKFNIATSPQCLAQWGPWIGLALLCGGITYSIGQSVVVAKGIASSTVLLGWSALVTTGFLANTLLGSKFFQDKLGQVLPVLITLSVISALVFLATRLYGTWGLIALAAGSVFLNHPKSTPILGLFLVARILLQDFLYLFNTNVTGINVTHPYASAALFAGLVWVLLVPVLFSSKNNPSQGGWGWILPGLYLVISLLLPGYIGYFVHTEALGSFLNATLFGGFAVALLAPICFKSTEESSAPTLTLATPLILILSSLMTTPLLDWGTEADRTLRLSVIGITGVVLCLLAFWLSNSKSSPPNSVSIPVS